MSFAGGSTVSNGAGHWASPSDRHCARSAAGPIAGVKGVSPEPREVAGDSNANTRATLNRRTNVMSTPCAPPKPTDPGDDTRNSSADSCHQSSIVRADSNALERAAAHRDGEL